MGEWRLVGGDGIFDDSGQIGLWDIDVGLCGGQFGSGADPILDLGSVDAQ